MSLYRSQKILVLNHTEILDDIKAIKDRLKGQEKPLILDVGCGCGKISRGVNNLLGGKARIIGVDLDLIAMKYGRSIDRGICYLRSHISYLPSETTPLTSFYQTWPYTK